MIIQFWWLRVRCVLEKKVAILEYFVGGGDTSWFYIPHLYMNKHGARATAHYNGILRYIGSIGRRRGGEGVGKGEEK